jgi:L-aspartate oxidase
MSSIDTDVLVIGAGAAGLCAAISAAPRRVLVVSAEDPRAASSTALAQGGIAAPLGAGDSVRSQWADTLAAGCHTSDPRAALRIIRGAGEAVRFLSGVGVRFDHGESGWRVHLEAGHSHPRVLHAEGDRTGSAILAALLAHAAGCGHIELLSGLRVARLLGGEDGGIAGALGFDRAGAAVRISARDTVLATGGLGGLFPSTTNGRHANGDGLAMALSRGARVAGLEFVQFHPTALKTSEDPAPLLTEALRGAGAFLLDARGDRLMKGAHPLGDLAPRDVVARAVWERGLRGEGVWLDATPVFRSERAGEFPLALHTCRSHGLDPAREPVPITAAAHYHMGGIVVDPLGRTDLPGLWACGEVACTGMHGANRLASNSLLEAVVCGRIAGESLAHSSPVPRKPREQVEGAGDISADRHGGGAALRAIMGRCMGPLREGGELQSGLRELAALRESLAPEALTVRQRLDLSIAMVRSALSRRESRGAHWRSDFPRRNPKADAR